MRLVIERAFWVLGVVVPLATALVLDFHLYFSVIQPSLPFLCLALVCRFARKLSLASVIGAAIPAFVIVLGVYGWGLYDSYHTTYSGANIGLGILVAFMPVYLIPLMIIGGLIFAKIWRELYEKRT